MYETTCWRVCGRCVYAREGSRLTSRITLLLVCFSVVINTVTNPAWRGRGRLGFHFQVTVHHLGKPRQERKHKPQNVFFSSLLFGSWSTNLFTQPTPICLVPAPSSQPISSQESAPQTRALTSLMEASLHLKFLLPRCARLAAILSPTFLIKTGSLSQIHSIQIRLVLQANLLRDPVSAPEARFTAGTPYPSGMY